MAHIAILLATFNGQRFLKKQLDSIASQEDVTWTLWASDDGSQDGTVEILTQYQAVWGADKLKILHGPCQGFVKNFFSLLTLPQVEADYFAFCDQDDVWHPRKLITAVQNIQAFGDQCVLYGGRTRLVNEYDQFLGFSPAFLKSPSFENALVQSIMGGNTLVFNQPAKLLLAKACVGAEVITHDWWAYLTVSACGGKVVYDPIPQIDYRQHSANLIGMNQGIAAKLKRLTMMVNGYFKLANDKNVQALSSVSHLMTPESRDALTKFELSRKASSGLKRTLAFLRSKVFRQTISGQCGLWLAFFIRRL